MAGVRRRGGAGRKLARPAGAKYLSPMLKLLKLAVLLGLVATFLFVLPFGGRTLFDRWRAAGSARAFASRTWAEMRGVDPPGRPTAPAAPRKARPGRPPAAGEPQPAPDHPVESTTEADRQALDKLLDQHLTDQPRR
jgi:hypothetical protein